MNEQQAPATRYPLSWPSGWIRTKPSQRSKATFRSGGGVTVDGDGLRRAEPKRVLSVADALKRLSRELAALGATHELLSTNVEIKLDGLPYSNRREPVDPGAAVYFKLLSADRCLACDKWDRVADNIAALAQHIDAIRRIERYGVGTIEQAFRGYAALPEAVTDWWVILGVHPNADRTTVDAAFRTLAFAAHPDRGGSHEQMARLSEARAAAYRSLL